MFNLIKRLSVSRDTPIAHYYCCGREAFGRHVRVESAQTETVRRWTLLPATRDIWHREQEPGHEGIYHKFFFGGPVGPVATDSNCSDVDFNSTHTLFFYNLYSSFMNFVSRFSKRLNKEYSCLIIIRNNYLKTTYMFIFEFTMLSTSKSKIFQPLHMLTKKPK